VSPKPTRYRAPSRPPSVLIMNKPKRLLGTPGNSVIFPLRGFALSDKHFKEKAFGRPGSRDRTHWRRAPSGSRSEGTGGRFPRTRHA
jgi:hypothetical protein